MNNLFKGKAGTIIILLFTVVLAGVAIFTAIRLYQLRSQPVAPNVPSSIPKAGGVCGGIAGTLCPTGEECVYAGGAKTAPSPDATGTCQVATAKAPAAAAGSCSLSFTLAVSTATPTPTPTPTPVPLCNSVCTTEAQCSTGLVCYIPTGATTGNCRNNACTGETDCLCATPTPTPTPTTPSGTPNACNGTCGSNANCNSGLVCSSGFCRNPSCVTSTSCTCSGTPGPTPTPAPTLPQSGSDWPTVVGFAVGILVILGSLLLAL